jgi:hypothetical protein
MIKTKDLLDLTCNNFGLYPFKRGNFWWVREFENKGGTIITVERATGTVSEDCLFLKLSTDLCGVN